MNKVKVLSFICPDCGGQKLECCQDGPHSSEITCVSEDGDFEYGPIRSEAEVDRFQCNCCGFVLKDNNGVPLMDLEVVEWVKKNCPQE